jgi:hypothetical protein
MAFENNRVQLFFVSIVSVVSIWEDARSGTAKPGWNLTEFQQG